MSEKLTPKQAIFLAEYLVDGNGTRAAIAAGVPEKSAAVTASRWLKNRRIAALLTERHARRTTKLEITAERVLDELAKLAFYDPGKLFDAHGNLLAVPAMDDVTRAVIVALDVETKDSRGARSITKKVKLADKGLNLERLGRYLKLFTDRVEHDGRVTLEQLVCGEAKEPDDAAA